MGVEAGITVRGGHADNAEMVRTDVFRKGGKFFLVPIYGGSPEPPEHPTPGVTLESSNSL